MKRFALIMLADGYNSQGEWVATSITYQTDDVRQALRVIAEQGHDVGINVDDDFKAVESEVEEAARELIATTRWDIGDGSNGLVLVDMQKIDHTIEV